METDSIDAYSDSVPAYGIKKEKQGSQCSASLILYIR